MHDVLKQNIKWAVGVELTKKHQLHIGKYFSIVDMLEPLQRLNVIRVRRIATREDIDFDVIEGKHDVVMGETDAVLYTKDTLKIPIAVLFHEIWEQNASDAPFKEDVVSVSKVTSLKSNFEYRMDRRVIFNDLPEGIYKLPGKENTSDGEDGWDGTDDEPLADESPDELDEGELYEHLDDDTPEMTEIYLKQTQSQE